MTNKAKAWQTFFSTQNEEPWLWLIIAKRVGPQTLIFEDSKEAKFLIADQEFLYFGL